MLSILSLLIFVSIIFTSEIVSATVYSGANDGFVVLNKCPLTTKAYSIARLATCIMTGKSSSVKYVSIDDSAVPGTATYMTYKASNCTGSATTVTNTSTCAAGGLVQYAFTATVPVIKSGFTIAYYNSSSCGKNSITGYYFDPSNTARCNVNSARVCSAYDSSFPVLGANTIQTCFDIPANAGECFAASETVQLLDGSTLSLDRVKVGDRVLAVSRGGYFKYAQVIALPHAANDVRALFIQVSFAGGSLRLTPDHLLLATTCSATASSATLVRAASLSVGSSCILTPSGLKLVTSLASAYSHGIYSVVTTEDLVVVSGVVASPFACNHAVPNAFYSIYRALFSISPQLILLPQIASLPSSIGKLLLAGASV